MSLLRSAFSSAFALSTIRSSAALPAVSLLSHQNRFFSNSPQNYKREFLKSAPGWNEDNASESEADIKADREPLPKDMKDLQRESVQQLEDHKNEGKVVEGFGSFSKAVNDFRHDFEQGVGSAEKKVHQKGEEVLRDVKHTADSWKKSTNEEVEGWKKTIEKEADGWKKAAEANSWKKSVDKEAESVVGGIKKSTKEFVKKHLKL
ncbi:hypothetical protein EMPS_08595 [Entomortierella parvispora]|uniref:Uncharacterized protein n=1 Tax=Entomortierella parvispora TaxID=205924 RepID=A0A9P3HGP2_9FUNG|nr:hypothetical protein EMPS_08595 [Entomortierella parvispora]